jgi:hypothetical protein
MFMSMAPIKILRAKIVSLAGGDSWAGVGRVVNPTIIIAIAKAAATARDVSK